MLLQHLSKHLETTSFEGVCLTTVILAPGASEVGLGAAALAPLCPDPGKMPGSGDEFREVTFSAQAADIGAKSSELGAQI